MCGTALPPGRAKHCSDHHLGRQKKRKCADRTLDLKRARAEDELGALDERGGRHGLASVRTLRMVLEAGVDDLRAADLRAADALRVLLDTVCAERRRYSTGDATEKAVLNSKLEVLAKERDEARQGLDAKIQERQKLLDEKESAEKEAKSLAEEKKASEARESAASQAAKEREAALNAQIAKLQDAIVKLGGEQSGARSSESASMASAIADLVAPKVAEMNSQSIGVGVQTAVHTTLQKPVASLEQLARTSGEQLTEERRKSVYTQGVEHGKEVGGVKANAELEKARASFEKERARDDQKTKELVASIRSEADSQTNKALAIAAGYKSQVNEFQTKADNAAKRKEEAETKQRELQAQLERLMTAEAARRDEEARRRAPAAKGKSLEVQTLAFLNANARGHQRLYAMDTSGLRNAAAHRKDAAAGALGYHDLVVSAVKLERYTDACNEKAFRPAGDAVGDTGLRRNDRRCSVELKNFGSATTVTREMVDTFFANAAASVKAGCRAGHCFLLAAGAAVEGYPDGEPTWRVLGGPQRQAASHSAQGEESGGARVWAGSPGSGRASSLSRYWVCVAPHVPCIETEVGQLYVRQKVDEALAWQRALHLEEQGGRPGDGGEEGPAAAAERARQKRALTLELFERGVACIKRVDSVRHCAKSLVAGQVGALRIAAEDCAKVWMQLTDGTHDLSFVEHQSRQQTPSASDWIDAVRVLRANGQSQKVPKVLKDDLGAPSEGSVYHYVCGSLSLASSGSGSGGGAAAAPPTVAANTMYNYVQAAAPVAPSVP